MTNANDINPAAAVSSTQLHDVPVVRPEHAEGFVARLIEQQTAKVPSHWFLGSAFASMLLSMGFEVRHRPRLSHFFGMWVAPLLVMGVYNKIVKVTGVR